MTRPSRSVNAEVPAAPTRLEGSLHSPPGARFRPTVFSNAVADRPLASLAPPGRPLSVDALNALAPVPGGTAGEWEIEIGFGKGRYLLERARSEPHRRFLGIELVGQYQRLLLRRARKLGLTNLVACEGEGLYLLSAVLPRHFASAVHVYFPDPWPKTRHQRRRLFDPETVDLVLDLLTPDGRLWFATDHPDYGPAVRQILTDHPALAVTVLDRPWPQGPRTNYEAKYVDEGRPILRLEARLRDGYREAEADRRHPAGVVGLVAAGPSAPGEGAPEIPP